MVCKCEYDMMCWIMVLSHPLLHKMVCKVCEIVVDTDMCVLRSLQYLPIGWIVMSMLFTPPLWSRLKFQQLLDGLKFGTNIHVPLRMNCNNFGEPLSFILMSVRMLKFKFE